MIIAEHPGRRRSRHRRSPSQDHDSVAGTEPDPGGPGRPGGCRDPAAADSEAAWHWEAHSPRARTRGGGAGPGTRSPGLTEAPRQSRVRPPGRATGGGGGGGGGPAAAETVTVTSRLARPGCQCWPESLSHSVAGCGRPAPAPAGRSRVPAVTETCNGDRVRVGLRVAVNAASAMVAARSELLSAGESGHWHARGAFTVPASAAADHLATPGPPGPRGRRHGRHESPLLGRLCSAAASVGRRLRRSGVAPGPGYVIMSW